MTSTAIKQKLYQISEELLQALLNHKKDHAGFTFSLRRTDSNRSKEERLTKGQWFQGSDYILVPPFRRSDPFKKIKTFGFTITFSKEGTIDRNFIEISSKSDDFSQTERQFYNELANRLNIKLQVDNCGGRLFPNPENYLENLNHFLNNDLPIALDLIQKYNLQEQYLVPEDVLQKRLQRIGDIKSGKKEPQGNSNEDKRHSLNTILYGPPGTGKTYTTVEKALAIIGDDTKGKSRADIQSLFKKRVNEKRIVFTTFHQSMSYEEFIEGIKPVKPEQAGDLHFEVVDGIFKNICSEAVRVSHYSITVDSKEKELTKELFEELYYNFSATLPMNTEEKSGVELRTKEKSSFELFRNSAETIVVKSGEKRTHLSVSYTELSAVLFHNKKPFYVSYEEPIINKILEGKNFQRQEVNSKAKNFVLIIDEINRGNVAQIFGELISLIEDDKRAGKPEAIQVLLPYSKSPFSVPANVYIVGTMNTADRSVEALDTALRRRFVFEEMPPKPELLSPHYILKNLWSEYPEIDMSEFEKTKIEPLQERLNIRIDFAKHRKMDEESYDMSWEDWERLNPKLYFKDVFTEENGYVDFEKLLSTINERLALLIDKDHTIGHAWLMGCYSPKQLRKAFENKIIPLLKEYFYNDYGKIGLVLGDDFVKVKTQTSAPLFASFSGFDKSTVSELAQKKLYKLIMPDTDEALMAALRSIYKNKTVSDAKPD